MGAIKGDTILITVGGTTMTCQVNGEMSLDGGTIETTCKTTANNAKAFLPARHEGNISGTLRYDNEATYGASEVIAAIQAGTEVAFTFGEATGTAGNIWYSGNGYFTSFSLSSNLDEVSEVSFELIINGSVTEVTGT